MFALFRHIQLMRAVRRIPAPLRSHQQRRRSPVTGSEDHIVMWNGYTPEELARKTAALTGVQWERHIGTVRSGARRPSALTGEYRLLYGGIDSDGITERARDMTSVWDPTSFCDPTYPYDSAPHTFWYSPTGSSLVGFNPSLQAHFSLDKTPDGGATHNRPTSDWTHPVRIVLDIAARAD